ncbi:MAG: alpha-L-fucosidase [Salinispira sp.]
MFNTQAENLKNFINARFGMFVHYGLYSLRGQDPWYLNKEKIPLCEYKKLAEQFTAREYNADKLCAMAQRAGMKYICLTTMHHDGFMLYDSALSEFNSVRYGGRDLVQETIEAARKYALRIHLYHSLNHWTATPDGADALESAEHYETFITFTFQRIRELLTKYNPIDVLWYDGWWPFNAKGWQAEKMNEMVREIQPWILVNGRNGLAGDFTTPEQQMKAPNPWKPWEACITLNDNWAYVRDDLQWKSQYALSALLVTAAKGNGNLLLGIGPEPDGGIPEEAERILERIGKWLHTNREAFSNNIVFDLDLEERKNSLSDWSPVCDFTASGNTLYIIVTYWQSKRLIITGLQTPPETITLLENEQEYPFEYESETGKLIIKNLPEDSPGFRPIFRVTCRVQPEIYGCGGMRRPTVPHPPYDPCTSDLNW